MRLTVALFALLLVACEGSGDGEGSAEGSSCGPSTAVVKRVIDGDTVELEDGSRVRYLMIDTPESTNGKDDCFGTEATDLNRMLVEGKEVTLHYDVECTDIYDRLLAYIEVNGREINSLMVERGAACVLHIPPNGEDRVDEFEALEAEAREALVGLWGACEDVTCD